MPVPNEGYSTLPQQLVTAENSPAGQYGGITVLPESPAQLAQDQATGQGGGTVTTPNATGIFPTLEPGGTIVPAAGTGGSNVFPTPTGAAPSNVTGSPSVGPAVSGATVAAGTSGNPFVDAAEWAANLLNKVPIIGPGIAAVLTDGVQAVAYMTHDLAYALDTAVSVFKPGQAWRFVFAAVTVLLGTMAFRAWTGRSLMPSAPAVIPV